MTRLTSCVATLLFISSGAPATTGRVTSIPLRTRESFVHGLNQAPVENSVIGQPAPNTRNIRTVKGPNPRLDVGNFGGTLLSMLDEGDEHFWERDLEMSTSPNSPARPKPSPSAPNASPAASPSSSESPAATPTAGTPTSEETPTSGGTPTSVETPTSGGTPTSEETPTSGGATPTVAGTPSSPTTTQTNTASSCVRNFDVFSSTMVRVVASGLASFLFFW
jgi:hypothetical protein